MIALPDVNVLVYAVDQTSTGHAACAAWLQNQLNGKDEVLFAWNVLIGFVRISTNAKAMAAPLTLSEAFDYVDDWLSQPMIRMAMPEAKHAKPFREACLAGAKGGNLVSDAHLAALAMEQNAVLCTCDADFRKFPGLSWQHLISGKKQKNP